MRFIAVLLLLAQVAFGAVFKCKYTYNDNLYSCNLEQATISITEENQPITVTGTHQSSWLTNEFVNLLRFINPHVLNFVPSKVFETFKKLKRFEMIAVELTHMTTNAFTNCLDLETLSVVQNNFPVLPTSFAEACVNLRTLTLSHNNIETIEKDAFKGLGSLFQMDLMMNKIASLPALQFVGSKGPLNIHLGMNTISEVDPELITILKTKLEEFNLMMAGNICSNHKFSAVSLPQDWAYMQPCFDNWVQFPSYNNN
jgi:Leucine-rich repeat (LRR) protein